MFRQFRYSFFIKTCNYISDIEKIRLNLIFYGDANSNTEYYGNEFSKSFSEYRKLSFKQDCYTRYISEDLEKYYKKDSPSIKENGYMNLASRVYESANLLERGVFEMVPSGTPLRNKVAGRYKDKTYVLTDFEKIDVVKNCIGTGHPDDIGEYMISSGFWDFDLTNLAELEENLERVESLSALDLFVVYIFRLRDEIINSWSDNTDKQNKKSWIKNRQDCFPLAALAALVTRDIEYIFVYEFSGLREDINMLKNSAPFYISESYNWWFMKEDTRALLKDRKKRV